MRQHISLRKIDKQQRGFTIIELMIATTVLAVILVLVSAMMIGIGNLYYKGINQAKVQDDTRSIIDDLTENLQLNDSGPTTPPTTPDNKNIVVPPVGSIPGYTISAYCIGNTRYSYVVNKQIGSDATKQQIAHVLWRDTAPSDVCKPVDLRQSTPVDSTNGTELVSGNSRLTDFSVSTTSPYIVSVEVALGDSDLLSGSGQNINWTCKGNAGQQFCATSALSTVVTQRQN